MASSEAGERLQRAREAAVFAMPPREEYAARGVSDDLISGLQKRDLKWATSLSQNVIECLGSALLPAVVLPLTKAEAEALRELYLSSETGREKGTSAVADDGSGTAENDAALEDLEERLNELLRGFAAARLRISLSTADGETPEFAAASARRNTSGGAFVKLAFMSPKDVALHTGHLRTRLELIERLDECWSVLPWWRRVLYPGPLASSDSLSGTDVWGRVWLGALYAALRVDSGREAIDMLAKSYRISEEIEEALMDDGAPFSKDLIVRPWKHIRPGFEFRVFVSNGEITGASQYESVHYPEVWAERHRIREGVSSFVRERVVPAMESHLKSFSVDVAAVDAGPGLPDEFRVVEFNPFASSTSACLFNWGADRVLLMTGPEEWRFVAPGESKPMSVPDDWKETVDTILSSHRRDALTTAARTVAGVATAVVVAWKTGLLAEVLSTSRRVLLSSYE
jgi:D123